MKEVAIGIDIGGTFTKIGIVDKEGNLLSDAVISTDEYNEIEVYVKAVHQKIQELKSNISEGVDIKGIGIGAPNGNYYKGTIEHAPNLKWKGVVEVVAEFKKHYDIPVVLTNDANAAAIGEQIYGGAKDINDFMVITLGTGLGSGIVINGKLVYGHDGFAGEFGHVTVRPDGRTCGCGRKGCLETYVSATGIKRTLTALLATSLEETEFRNICYNDLTAKMISDAANKGDKVALEAFEITGKILGTALADAIAINSPQAIFLFGGLANAGDLIFDPTKKYLEEKILPIFKNKVQIKLSELQATNAAIVGASALAWKELLKLQ